MVRTRIAPSPTGFPHIGTIYQALFDYGYAKKNAGQFIVRIEDTDRLRLVAGAEEKIYQSLDWFGLTEDESRRKGGDYGPYRQSERLKIYQSRALELIKNGYAYYCFCSKERLEEVRKRRAQEKKIPMYDKYCRALSAEDVQEKLSSGLTRVVRMKVPENTAIKVRDEIRGEIVFDSNTVDDQVLLKSDGFPTYHLAVVVDDHLMKITHAVRGEEWISSTPKHFLLYDFFGWERPLFFHTSLLRNPDRYKLSKRHGHTNVAWYQEQGFLPEAILNYLALMGWSHPQGKEIFSKEEFIGLLELKNMKAVAPVFDIHKLEWMNGEYIRNLEAGSLKSQLVRFIGKNYDEKLVEKTIPLVRERMKKLVDYMPLCSFFFETPTGYEIDLSAKKDIFVKMKEELNKLNDWKAEPIGEAMLVLAKRLNVKNSEFFMSLRVAITGKKISPPLNESMEILGKKDCLTRIGRVIAAGP
ncbi:glutamate--tRNA ligase [Candidatus Roizmanbacteria bacterium]|nr:glutamate--tRNA ligase [Candidatus Roizmanbacteria bacterium]